MRFYLDYQWTVQQATASLVVYYPDRWVELVRGQYVGRLRELRRLLHHDVTFRTTWLVSKVLLATP